MKLLSVRVSHSESRPTLTPGNVAHQAPLSMDFPRREYCSGLPLPSPGDLPNPGIISRSPALQADSLPSKPPGKPHNTLGNGQKCYWVSFPCSVGHCLVVPSGLI